MLVVRSEHEGFCVPLLEAMYHGVPIVAYAAAAVPETLGDAGVLLDVKDACTVAAAVDRVVRDDELRAQLVAAGTRASPSSTSAAPARSSSTTVTEVGAMKLAVVTPAVRHRGPGRRRNRGPAPRDAARRDRRRSPSRR